MTARLEVAEIRLAEMPIAGIRGRNLEAPRCGDQVVEPLARVGLVLVDAPVARVEAT